MRGFSQGSSSTGKAYVLDAAGIFAGLPLRAPGLYFTCPGVLEEVRDENSLRIVEEALALGRLRVESPGPTYVDLVLEGASGLGEALELSDTDLEVLALALQLKDSGFSVVVVTDDYAVQNVATQLSLEFMPVKTRGISSPRRYKVYCPACGYAASGPDEKTCPVCGSRLVRRRVRS